MGELLWIDSVCIDQTNSAEVNSQVALMGHIYSSCQLTIAWLASDDEYLMAGVTRIQMIRDVAKPHVPAEWKFIIEEALLNSPINGNFQEIGLPNFTEDLPISLYVLLNRAWFKRAWIVQEATLSQSLILLTDYHTIPWHYVYVTVRFLAHTGWYAQIAKDVKDSVSDQQTQLLIASSIIDVYLWPQMVAGCAPVRL